MAQKRPDRIRGLGHDTFWDWCAQEQLRLQRCGRCGKISCSLPAAIKLPVKVSEPRMTSADSTAIMNGGTSGACR